MTEHIVKTINHRGEEVILSKPVNESAMTEAERLEWHKAKAKAFAEKEGKK